jgi:nucleotide-binding universal stress UspA family protein
MPTRILLPLFTYPDASPEGGLRAALTFAASLEATVSVLAHEARIPPVTEPLAPLVIDIAAMIEAAETLSRSNGERLVGLVEAEGTRLGLPLKLGKLRAGRLVGESMAKAARTFDFTFIAGIADSPDHALMTEDILFHSGGPAIVFPSQANPMPIETVAVAWDASRASSRALRDALPIVKRARRVVILSVTDDKDIPDAATADVATFLSGHDVNTTALTIARGASPIGEALQNRALEQGANLLVMGAYGHSRLREFVLGGATKSVLLAPKLPVLMSH